MDGEAMTGYRRGEATGFPETANPNLRISGASEPWREIRGEARSFAERCDPRRSNRPLTDDQRELVTRYMPLARALARRARGKSLAYDELKAEAYGAAVEAARTFDPERGVDFSVYARPRIIGALRDYRRFLVQVNWKDKRRGSRVFRPLSSTEVDNGRLLGREPGAPTGHDLELSEVVAWIIRRLPHSESVACRLLYIEGKSCDETAHKLNRSKGHVSRLRGEALDRIRRVYAEALAG